MLKTISILLITERRQQLLDFVEAIQKETDIDLLVATTVQDAIHIVDYHAPALIIVDEQVGKFSGVDLVRRIIEINAFVNTAVLTSLAEEEFHHRSEGLGILSALPAQPGEKDASKLLKLLQQLISKT